MTPGRWLAPIGTSVAVLAVVVAPGLLAVSGRDGGGPGPDRTPDGVVTPGDPVTPDLPPDGAEESRLGPREVEITGYRSDGRVLRVFYTVDQTTNCSSTITRPRVRETVNSVVVRLQRRGSRDADEVCTSRVLGSSVDVELSRPMGGRVLQDGSRGGSLVPPSQSKP